MRMVFRITGVLLIFMLALYLFIIAGPIEELIKYRIEKLVSERFDLKVKIGRLDTNLFTTVMLRNVEVSTKGPFATLRIDKVALDYSPFFFIRRGISGHLIDDEVKSIFFIKFKHLFKQCDVNFKIFPRTPTRLNRFLSRQVTSFSDVSINNAVVLLGNISFSPRVKSPIEFSLNLILSGASVYSERLNFYLSGIYGKVPINSMENKMRERLFIKNANIKNIELDNIRTVISSSNSLLNLDDIEYNIYGANGRGSADLSLDKTLFNLELEVKSLDLEKLDNASKGFKTKTKGLVDLYLLIRLMGHEIGVLDIRANSVEAGQIEQELILALLNYLPKEKQTGWLIDELAKEGEFVYDEFKGEFSKKKDKYFLNLTLDGRHLIEFDISVEEEALGTLIDLLR